MRLENGRLIGQLFGHHGLAEIYVHVTAGLLLFIISVASYLIIRHAFHHQYQGWPLLRAGVAFSGLIGLGEAGEHLLPAKMFDFLHYLHMSAAPIALLFYYLAILELRAFYYEGKSLRSLSPAVSVPVSLIGVLVPMSISLLPASSRGSYIEMPFLWLTVLPTLFLTVLVLRESITLYSRRTKLPVLNMSIFSTVLASVPAMATLSALLAVTIWFGRLSDNVPELSFFYAGSHTWLDIWMVLLAGTMAASAMALVAVKDVRKMQERILASARWFAFGEVASEVADQLTTPIALIRDYASLLSSEQDLPETLRSDAKAVGQEAETIEKLAGELVELLKTSESRVQVTNLKQLLDDALTIMNPRLRHGGIRVSRKFERPLPFVAVDRIEIRRAILSLLGNAADAMPSGGRIHLSAWSEDDMACFTIVDYGPGIEPEMMQRITEAFYSTKDGAGNGMGLPLAKALIEKAGGTLDITSTVGKGTTVTIRLPVVSQEFVSKHLATEITRSVSS